jgi:hypothetical protein
LQPEKILFPVAGAWKSIKSAKSPLVFSNLTTILRARLQVEALSDGKRIILFPAILLAVSEDDLAVSNYFKLIAPENDRG